jgi:hypothetical protein
VKRLTTTQLLELLAGIAADAASRHRSTEAPPLTLTGIAHGPAPVHNASVIFALIGDPDDRAWYVIDGRRFVFGWNNAQDDTLELRGQKISRLADYAALAEWSLNYDEPAEAVAAHPTPGTVHRAELDRAVDQIASALINAGQHVGFHEYQISRLEERWPALTDGLRALLQVTNPGHFYAKPLGARRGRQDRRSDQ